MIAFLAVFSFITFRNLSAQSGHVLGFATDVNVEHLLQQTNERRQSQGLKPLSLNPQLSQAASQKATDMFIKNYWAHFGPNGETPWQFITSSGYKYDFAGENLAKNFDSSSGVVTAWMDSPTHRDNIMSANYDEVGFSITNGTLDGEETTLVVQMFGRREAPIVASATDAPTSLQNVAAKTLDPTTAPKPSRVLTQPTSSNRFATPQPGLEIPKDIDDLASAKKLITLPQTKTPSINLYPAFKSLVAMLVAFLVSAFVIDLYYLSHLNQTSHRGRHIAHIIFLLSILFAMFFLGRGSIL